MKKVNSLEIVYCKDCKHFRCKVVDKYSAVYSCSKGNAVDTDRPELRCNKSCYQKKWYKKKAQKKS